MRVFAVVGHTGVVGTALCRVAEDTGRQVLGISRHAVPPHLVGDLEQPESVIAGLESIDPSVVILTAALTDVDFCEREPQRSARVNVAGPLRVAEWCSRHGAHLVFVSSDYVFDGTAGPYSEEAQTNPVNVYGEHKAEAEAGIEAILPQSHLIVRTTGVFGEEQARKNFVLRLCDRVRNGETVKVPIDQIGNPTWSEDLAGAILSALDSGYRGLLHAAGATLLSRYDFALSVARVFALDQKRIIPVETETLAQPARRPSVGGLRSDRLRAIVGREMLSAEVALRRMLQDRRG